MSAVEAPGLDQLVRSAHRAADDLEDMSSTHLEVATLVAGVAASTVTPRTGRTAASVRPGASTDTATVTVGVRHAVPLHFGWTASNGRTVSPQPFLSRAWEDHRVIELYTDQLHAAVNTVTT